MARPTHSRSAPTAAVGLPATAAAGSVALILASRACEKCTRSKRKCDKAQPACGRCNRLNVRCNYDFVHAPNISTSRVASIAANSESTLIPEQVDIASLLFRGGEVGIILSAVDSLNAPVHVAPAIDELLAEQNIDWRKATEEYFRTVNRWFSILHREKFDSTFNIPQNTQARVDKIVAPTADTALLLLCMLLVIHMEPTRQVAVDVFSPLYHGAKRAFRTLHCLAQPTLELTQCGTLLTMFEYGHGDALSAYHTLNETVALGRVYGVHPGRMSDATTGRMLDVNDLERHCLWWSLFMLDQCIHDDAAIAGFPFAVDAAPSDVFLPPNTERPRPGNVFTLPCYPSDGSMRPFVPYSRPLTAFQRAAQSALLLNRALRNVPLDNSLPFPPAASPSPSPLSPPQTTSSPGALAPLSEALPNIPSADLTNLDWEIRKQLNELLELESDWEFFCFCTSMLLSAFLVLYVPAVPHLAALNPSSLPPPSSPWLVPAVDSNPMNPIYAVPESPGVPVSETNVELMLHRRGNSYYRQTAQDHQRERQHSQQFHGLTAPLTGEGCLLLKALAALRFAAGMTLDLSHGFNTSLSAADSSQFRERLLALSPLGAVVKGRVMRMLMAMGPSLVTNLDAAVAAIEKSCQTMRHRWLIGDNVLKDIHGMSGASVSSDHLHPGNVSV